jgi:uncharacterized membrane protein
VNQPASPSPAAQRIEFIDLARGIALIAMAIYHFSWDLEFFGWIAPSTTLTGGWLVFARSIATSFLILVGISLVLAHGSGTRWRSFWKRWVQVAGAAAAISLVTWYAMPGGFIFFGILHAIALYSLLGLFFVRAHWLVPFGVGIVILLVWQTYTHEVFSNAVLWWVGLAPIPPLSNDYVPVFPWFAAVLTGIGLSQLMKTKALWSTVDGIALPSRLQHPVIFIGRNSLIFYLVHQPVLLASVWLFTTFVAQPDRTPHFVSQCQTTCAASKSEGFCQSFCGCLVTELKREKLFVPLLQLTVTEEQNARILETRELCIAREN